MTSVYRGRAGAWSTHCFEEAAPPTERRRRCMLVAMSDDDVLRKLPKVELHRHLDGSVRISTIWDIAQKNGLDLGVRSYDELLREGCPADTA